MRKLTVACGLLTLLSAGRGAAQILDAQTQIGLRADVLPGAIYGVSGSGIPPVAVLEAPGREISAGPEIGAIVRLPRSDETVSEHLRRSVVVESVSKDGPASRAGLQPGDVIFFYADPRVDETRQFAHFLHEARGGQVLRLSVVRNGAHMMIDVTPQLARAGSSERP